MEVDVRDMAIGGEAVAVGPDGVVLVAGGAPGERLVLRDVRRSGGVLRGRVHEVLRGSPDRRAPACPIVDRCGGCPWMHLTPQAQGRLKAGFVAEALQRSGQPGEVTFHAASAEEGWRRRARLTWQGGALGFRGRRSKRTVDVPECRVLTIELRAALEALRAEVMPSLGGAGEVSLAQGCPGVSVVLRPAAGQDGAAYAACEALAERPGIDGVELVDPGSGAVARWGDPRDVMTTADGLGVRAIAGGFSQANDAVNRAMVEVVAQLVQPDGAAILELYSGAGNLTVALAPAARKYVAVESDAAAVQACRGNLATRGLKGPKLVVGDAASGASGRYDVVVLDPPRSGARAAIPAMLKVRPARIVYVSCDPKTLERDLGSLAEHGWGVTAAHGFDMFPQTAHVEAVVRLERLP